MDLYTNETKQLLETSFYFKKDGIYVGHQPIYGYRNKYSANGHISRYIITKSILNNLSQFNFKNFADVGGAEGYTSNLVKQIFSPTEVVLTDLSEKYVQKAREIFNLKAYSCDIHQLPFKDNEFDVVLCSETIEHVTNYKHAIEELLRITKNTLIITVPHETPEMVAETVRLKIPHGHINYFDTSTLNYLKKNNYKVTSQKISSPLLTPLRIIAEGYKKYGTKWHYKVYNQFTPLLNIIFGLRTANFLIDLDSILVKLFGLYNGVSYIIEKDTLQEKKKTKKIKAKDFTDIKVPLYKEL